LKIDQRNENILSLSFRTCLSGVVRKTKTESGIYVCHCDPAVAGEAISRPSF